VFWGITCYLSTNSSYVKFIGFNLKVSHRRHVYNCWLVNNIWSGICRYCYDPSVLKIHMRVPSGAVVNRHNAKTKYRFHTAAILLFHFLQNIILIKVAYLSKIYYQTSFQCSVKWHQCRFTSQLSRKLRCRVVLQWHNILTKFHGNRSVVSKIERRDTRTDNSVMLFLLRKQISWKRDYWHEWLNRPYNKRQVGFLVTLKTVKFCPNERVETGGVWQLCAGEKWKIGEWK
jgi:hypothetical protein